MTQCLNNNRLSPDTCPPEPVRLHSNLESALTRLSNTDLATTPIHRVFVIGGASLYRETLGMPVSSQVGFVDRILLTRIISPDFEHCDVYMPDFLKKTTSTDGKDVIWERATHADLQAWVGSEVPEGVQMENGIEYEFQMWTRNS
jgi:dihydrofolate reductase